VIIFACQWCKDILTAGLAKGFFWTILLLLIVPFLLVALVSLLLLRATRRKRAACLPQAGTGPSQT